jgi:hypothetical protein
MWCLTRWDPEGGDHRERWLQGRHGGRPLKRYMAANPAMGIRFIQAAAQHGQGRGHPPGHQEATGEYLIVQDADLEYDPREYNDLLRPIWKGFADVVFGSRFMGHHPHRILFFWHSIGNKFLTSSPTRSTI